jgi:phosphoribosylamine--glycine ligase/phosphoribosylformylglycinamidine cyclo-ligase
LASQGYPEKAVSGKQLTLGMLPENVVCFHAGTKTDNGNIITAGGRVLGLTAWADSIESAIETVYSNVSNVSFEGMQYRKDIAQRAYSTDVLNG